MHRRGPLSPAAEAFVDDLERLGARVVPAKIPDPDANTWPLFFHEAAQSHRALFPERADEYTDNVRVKLELAQQVDPVDVDTAYGAVERWRRYDMCLKDNVSSKRRLSRPFCTLPRPALTTGITGASIGSGRDRMATRSKQLTTASPMPP